MKRNRFGINLDEGIPLSTKADFELLHVDCFAKTAARLHSWMEEGEKALLLGGQIGSGKSTLIKKALLAIAQKPEIILHFDQGTLNLDSGDFWGIILAGFIEAALINEVNLSFCKLPQELGGYEPDKWAGLLNALNPKELSMDAFAGKIALRKKIAENTLYIRSVVSEIGNRLQKKLGRAIFIIALGLDKFDHASAAFFSISEIVPVLAQFKTLFEVNAVHLFTRPGSTFGFFDRLFIPIAGEDAVVEMLAKRMGLYAKPVRREIEVLAQWSGGNPRQAIRLLDHFETVRRKQNRNSADCILFAINETAGDFFASSLKPSPELMKTIQRLGKIESSLISLPGDKETARIAIYGNWILIKELNDDASWPVFINPLIKEKFSFKISAQEPDMKLLNEYARSVGISPIGLNINPTSSRDGKNGEQDLSSLLASEIIEPIHTNLTEVFDILNSALLSHDRSDRVIIAYKNREVVEAARDYLFGKANTYEYQECRHFILEGGYDKQPLTQLEGIFAEETDIISLEFSGEWEDIQLDALDKLRDRFLDYEMIWWIAWEDLKRYLPHWIQLRQLFEIFVLEDELLASISKEEVENDIEFFTELADEAEGASNVVRYLKVVLDFLNEVRGGEGHGKGLDSRLSMAGDNSLGVLSE